MIWVHVTLNTAAESLLRDASVLECCEAVEGTIVPVCVSCSCPPVVSPRNPLWGETLASGTLITLSPSHYKKLSCAGLLSSGKMGNTKRSSDDSLSAESGQKVTPLLPSPVSRPGALACGQRDCNLHLPIWLCHPQLSTPLLLFFCKLAPSCTWETLATLPTCVILRNWPVTCSPRGSAHDQRIRELIISGRSSR